MTAGRPAEGALCRTVACALVVLVHVNIAVRGPLGAWWPGGHWGAPLAAAAVPAFLMLAGFGAEGGFALGRRLRRLGPPFLFWNGAVIASWAVLDGERPALGPALWTLLTGAWHLYFLAVLAQLLALHAAWRRWAPRLGARAVLAGALAVALVAHGVSEWALWSAGPDDGAFEAEARKLCAFWAVYYAAGVLLRREPSVAAALQRGRALAALAGVAAAAWGLYLGELGAQDARFGHVPRFQLLAGMVPLQLAGGLLLVAGCARLESAWPGRRAVTFLQALAPRTPGIYLVHAPLILWLYPLLQRAGLTTAQRWEAPALAAAVFALGLGAVGLADRRLPAPIRALLLAVPGARARSAPR